MLTVECWLSETKPKFCGGYGEIVGSAFNHGCVSGAPDVPYPHFRNSFVQQKC